MDVAVNLLDMHDFFVNEVTGSMVLFIIISIIAIAWLCAKLRFPNSAFILITALYLLIIGGWMMSVPLLAVVLFFVGLFVYWQISKMLQT